MRPKSELQKRVLALYRDVFALARRRPAEERAQIEAHARREFRKDISRANVSRIEYLLQRGRRQLDVLRMANTSGVRIARRGGDGEGGT
mmetsp:Transcript_19527/g.65580  ORF Transcript_19527/g.65580 Transcript_19527/m.65580 type:complete len:89 (+) Transcript_19527:104-370(+)